MKLKLEEMTLEQKLGMVLCARRMEEDDIEFIKELIEKRALGCIQPSVHETDLVNELVSKADYPIILINDAEQGYPGSDLPKIPMNSLSACGSLEYCRAFAKGIVRDSKKAGLNGAWGPVIDTMAGDAPNFVHRTFSDSPETVSKLSEEIAKVFKQNNFIACGKHYPDPSGISVDTHMREGFSEYTEEFVREHNLAPYKYLMERGLLTTIMVGHTLYKNIDPEYPASLSKKVLDIIREMGFDGVIFTDSFAMMGILQRFGEDNIYGMAMAAGNDIILPNYRTSVRSCYEKLKKNFEEGLFTEERLNEAVRRILELQDFVRTEPENPTEFTKEDEKLLNDVAKDCITAITDEGVSASLTDENKEKLFVVLTESGYESDDQTPEIMTSEWYSAERIADRIKENFPESTVEFIPEFSTWQQHEYILNKATSFKEVVVVTFCNTCCYMGTDGLTRRSEGWINSLRYSGKISAVVHFGNPFALKNLEHIPRKIFGYMIPDSQKYAIDVLAGKIEAKGKLPFAVDLK